MYTGTLIKDLLAIAERIQSSAALAASETRLPANGNVGGCGEGSKPEQFPQPLGLSAADGNLGLFLIVHP